MQKALFFTAGILFTVFSFAQTLNQRWLNQINQGKELYAVNNYQEAMTHFNKAAQMVPTDTTAYTYLLDCSYKTQNTEVFFDTFDKLSLLNYKSAGTYQMAVNLCMNVLKDYAKAVQYVEAAKKEFPNDKEILMADVNIYYKYGDYKAAKEKLNNVLTIYPDTKKAYDMLYHIQYNIEKNPAAAIKTLDKAREIFPNDVEFTKKQVNIYFETGQLDAAEEKFRKLIELNPTEAKHYYNLSLILYNKGEYQKSVELASKAIEYNPNFIEAIFNVGTFFYHRALKYNQALLEMTPYQYTYQGQGKDIELTAKSYFEAALPYFEKAVQLNTDELDAFENLNTIKTLLKNIEKNQQLTTPYFTDLENEDIHKVYPDYELTSFKLAYPNGQTSIEKGQAATLKITVKNKGVSSINNLNIRLFQPFVNAQIRFKPEHTIKELAPGAEQTIDIPIKHLTNNTKTLGIKQLDNQKNLIRFFVTGTDNRYSDLKQINIELGAAVLSQQTTEANNDEPFNSANKKSNTYLLIIAADDYAHWNKTNNRVEEAKQVEHILVNEYKIEPWHVHKLYDEKATRNNLINELIKIRAAVSKQDQLIIYYNGLTADLNGEGAWVPVDAPKDSPAKYLDNTTLLSFLNAIDIQHMLLLVNGFFAHQHFVPDNQVSFKPNDSSIKSRWGLAQCSKNKDQETNMANSVFSTALKNGLKNNTDKKLSASELVTFVKREMQNKNLTVPTGGPLLIDGNEGGDFILIKRP